MWEIVAATAAAEFRDVADVRQVTQLVIRTLLAALLGGLIGLEREMHGKPAGIRTHMLIALGSALFVLVPQQGGMDMESLSRVIQGLLAGVGLLCAGSILKSNSDDEQVTGLTSAAGLWMTSAIGVAIGLGRESTAIIATLLVLGILMLERPLRRLKQRSGDGPTG
ncbi:MgtC/SapB family protein [Ramlibacter sp.]|uniref:MgtC/SapB family protein n=1 Tax=Ramlibacter sp. TaxID=1917967 RepID=UPI003D1120F5